MHTYLEHAQHVIKLLSEGSLNILGFWVEVLIDIWYVSFLIILFRIIGVLYTDMISLLKLFVLLGSKQVNIYSQCIFET